MTTLGVPDEELTFDDPELQARWQSVLEFSERFDYNVQLLAQVGGQVDGSVVVASMVTAMARMLLTPEQRVELAEERAKILEQVLAQSYEVARKMMLSGQLPGPQAQAVANALALFRKPPGSDNGRSSSGLFSG